jgi:hypothetical protein
MVFGSKTAQKTPRASTKRDYQILLTDFHYALSWVTDHLALTLFSLSDMEITKLTRNGSEIEKFRFPSSIQVRTRKSRKEKEKENKLSIINK